MLKITNELRGSNIYPGDSFLKKEFVSFVMGFVGRGLSAVSRFDPYANERLNLIDDGFIFCMKVASKGPSITLKKINGYFKYLGKINDKNADVIVSLKNVDSALMFMTGKLNTGQAYAQHRMYVDGSIESLMIIMTSITLMICYLFPNFILKKLYVNIPKRNRSKFRIYIATLLGI